MTPSGIRTAYTDFEVAAVARHIARQPDGRRFQSRTERHDTTPHDSALPRAAPDPLRLAHLVDLSGLGLRSTEQM